MCGKFKATTEQRPVADPIKLFFFSNEEFLCFFAAKLGHFTFSDFFSICNKTAKIGKRRKKINGHYFWDFHSLPRENVLTMYPCQKLK